jgi:hypothetical protein
MLFDALLTEVFEDIVFNPTKIIQGTCLGPILPKHFYYYFYQCAIIITGAARFSALRGKNRTKLACQVQKL